MLNAIQKKNLKEESANAVEAVWKARARYLAKKESREQVKTEPQKMETPASSEGYGKGMASPDGQHSQT